MRMAATTPAINAWIATRTPTEKRGSLPRSLAVHAAGGLF
jgi:hypothetical protein